MLWQSDSAKTSVTFATSVQGSAAAIVAAGAVRRTGIQKQSPKSHQLKAGSEQRRLSER